MSLLAACCRKIMFKYAAASRLVPGGFLNGRGVLTFSIFRHFTIPWFQNFLRNDCYHYFLLFNFLSLSALFLKFFEGQKTLSEVVNACSTYVMGSEFLACNLISLQLKLHHEIWLNDAHWARYGMNFIKHSPLTSLTFLRQLRIAALLTEE